MTNAEFLTVIQPAPEGVAVMRLTNFLERFFPGIGEGPLVSQFVMPIGKQF